MKKIYILTTLLLSNLAMGQSFEEGEKIFAANCVACHQMDKKVIGPALQDAVASQGEDWVYKWVKNNEKLRKSGDAHATEIYAQYNGTAMPVYESLGDEGLKNLVKYLTDWKTVTAASKPVVEPSTETVTTSSSSEMSLPMKVMFGFIIMVFLLTAYITVNISKLLADKYKHSQSVIRYLLKKHDTNYTEFNDELDEFINTEVTKKVDEKVKELKSGINSKLKDFK